MKVYDISQELLGCKVFPGDPSPVRTVLMNIDNGDICNLSDLHMCVHNGTHVDSPFHFNPNGAKIDEMSLDCFVGMCYVAEHKGAVYGGAMKEILAKASALGTEYAKRILIKGDAYITEEAAREVVKAGCVLLGNESQTVGPEDAPAAVHRILLATTMTLLEGVRLSEVSEGGYLLNAAPINIAGSDGAPVRAILIEM